MIDESLPTQEISEDLLGKPKKKTKFEALAMMRELGLHIKRAGGKPEFSKEEKELIAGAKSKSERKRLICQIKSKYYEKKDG
jgi:hypothetical protein